MSEKDKNTEILKEMGFRNITGTLYKHDIYGYITLPEDFTLNMVTGAIFDNGMREKADQIRKNLYITK